MRFYYTEYIWASSSWMAGSEMQQGQSSQKISTSSVNHTGPEWFQFFILEKKSRPPSSRPLSTGPSPSPSLMASASINQNPPLPGKSLSVGMHPSSHSILCNLTSEARIPKLVSANLRIQTYLLETLFHSIVPFLYNIDINICRIMAKIVRTNMIVL